MTIDTADKVVKFILDTHDSEKKYISDGLVASHWSIAKLLINSGRIV